MGGAFDPSACWASSATEKQVMEESRACARRKFSRAELPSGQLHAIAEKLRQGGIGAITFAAGSASSTLITRRR